MLWSLRVPLFLLNSYLLFFNFFPIKTFVIIRSKTSSWLAQLQQYCRGLDAWGGLSWASQPPIVSIFPEISVRAHSLHTATAMPPLGLGMYCSSCAQDSWVTVKTDGCSGGTLVSYTETVRSVPILGRVDNSARFRYLFYSLTKCTCTWHNCWAAFISVWNSVI